MSGNRERIEDFPACDKCGKSHFWVIKTKNHKLEGVCLITNKYVQDNKWILEYAPYNHKFHMISKRLPIAERTFDMIECECGGCYRPATKETNDRIIQYAKILWKKLSAGN